MNVGDLIQIAAYGDRTLWGATSMVTSQPYLREGHKLGGHLLPGSISVTGKLGLIVSKDYNYLRQVIAYMVKIDKHDYKCSSLLADRYFSSPGLRSSE